MGLLDWTRAVEHDLLQPSVLDPGRVEQLRQHIAQQITTAGLRREAELAVPDEMRPIRLFTSWARLWGSMRRPRFSEWEGKAGAARWPGDKGNPLSQQCGP